MTHCTGSANRRKPKTKTAPRMFDRRMSSAKMGQGVLASHRASRSARLSLLFGAATAAGAQAAGAEPAAWRAFGECLGEAYQVADDVRDVAADPDLVDILRLVRMPYHLSSVTQATALAEATLQNRPLSDTTA